jgi:hypothetical protein
MTLGAQTTEASNSMKYNFDRAKPFYPIVISYLIALHAIKEMAAIGALGNNRSWNFDALSGTAVDRQHLQDSIQKLLGPLELSVTEEPKRLNIPIGEVAKEFVDNHSYLLEYQIRAALSILVMAHETTKRKPYRDNGELWEFLRHCRNAAAHNGKFHFENGEPRHRAKWRNIELQSSMHGEPLLTQPDGKGYLKLGDPIALLWELESSYTAITI